MNQELLISKICKCKDKINSLAILQAELTSKLQSIELDFLIANLTMKELLKIQNDNSTPVIAPSFNDLKL